MLYKKLLLTSFVNKEVYVREAKKIFLQVLQLRIKLLGITIEDLEDEQACKKYKIGRDDKQIDQKITQTARAQGIILVQMIWENDEVTISTPEVSPDYSITKLYIQSMFQKPSDEQPQT